MSRRSRTLEIMARAGLANDDVQRAREQGARDAQTTSTWANALSSLVPQLADAGLKTYEVAKGNAQQEGADYAAAHASDVGTAGETPEQVAARLTAGAEFQPAKKTGNLAMDAINSGFGFGDSMNAARAGAARKALVPGIIAGRDAATKRTSERRTRALETAGLVAAPFLEPDIITPADSAPATQALSPLLSPKGTEMATFREQSPEERMAALSDGSAPLPRADGKPTATARRSSSLGNLSSLTGETPGDVARTNEADAPQRAGSLTPGPAAVEVALQHSRGSPDSFIKLMRAQGFKPAEISDDELRGFLQQKQATADAGRAALASEKAELARKAGLDERKVALEERGPANALALEKQREDAALLAARARGGGGGGGTPLPGGKQDPALVKRLLALEDAAPLVEDMLKTLDTEKPSMGPGIAQLKDAVANYVPTGLRPPGVDKSLDTWKALNRNRLMLVDRIGAMLNSGRGIGSDAKLRLVKEALGDPASTSPEQMKAMLLDMREMLRHEQEAGLATSEAAGYRHVDPAQLPPDPAPVAKGEVGSLEPEWDDHGLHMTIQGTPPAANPEDVVMVHKDGKSGPVKRKDLARAQADGWTE